eukprot:GHUV01034049.1.p2 GENE.GHUV01034049.1~~GHUV01034049.1.p2  ORF type:complete len:117 (-),score=24.73 GHUV01034049.1:228-578(-)
MFQLCLLVCRRQMTVSAAAEHAVHVLAWPPPQTSSALSSSLSPLVYCILQMWQRGRSISKRDWTLLRVAVVACVNDVYYGRLFFGDPETQQVLWDCDVRPSDATFLALKVRRGWGW